MDHQKSNGRTSLRKWLSVAVVAGVLLVVPGVVLAAGGAFVDDDDSVFEANIEWLASAGVTAGCNPPTNDEFCPDDPVTRGQMAAFMQRFAQYIGAENGAEELMASTAWRFNADSVRVGSNPRLVTTVRSFDVPGSSGALVMTGVATVFEDLEDAAFNTGLIWLEVDGGGSCSDIGLVTFSVWDTVALGSDSATVAAAKAVDAGTHRVDLCAEAVDFSAVDVWGDLTVTWVPDVNSAGIGLSAADTESKRDIAEVRQRLVERLKD